MVSPYPGGSRLSFVDTSYLIALFDHRDSLHAQAITLGRRVARSRVHLVTTHLVLAEFLAHFSRARDDLRLGAHRYVAEMLTRSDVDVFLLTEALFARGLELYGARPDQGYSLTDCISMLICRDLKITDVLTSDTDFEHEGLRILLKDD